MGSETPKQHSSILAGRRQRSKAQGTIGRSETSEMCPSALAVAVLLSRYSQQPWARCRGHQIIKQAQFTSMCIPKASTDEISLRVELPV